VCDASATSPRVRDYGPEAVTGRGLLLVDRLSKRWGVEPDGAGLKVSQRRFSYLGGEADTGQRWRIPVVLRASVKHGYVAL
jgi:hypothetical protein